MTHRCAVVALAVAQLAIGACSPDSDRTEPERSAARTRPLVLEERDALWLVEDDGTRRRITAPRVAGFDYDSLALKQVEGRVILYWAAAPVLSPRANVVAYATKREAVAADTSGQSIWIVELATGRERALLVEPGHSFRPVGWLGDDVVVYIGDRPGVWGVDCEGAAPRLLAPGTFVAAAIDGSAIAVAGNVPNDVALALHTRDGVVALPPPPAGFAYLAQGSFSDDGRRLLLEAAADSGRTRLPLVYDVDRRRVETRGAPTTVGPR
ncbi:MAG TPA: hypothetical protein VF039_13070 [Longimicrobiales bacterium]